MINKSQYYYTIKGFQSPEICVIIRDVTKLLFDNDILLWVCWKRWARFFYAKENPPQRAGGVISRYILCIPSCRRRPGFRPDEPQTRKCRRDSGRMLFRRPSRGR